MPTELGPAFSPTYAGLPTHMSVEDHYLWLRYQRSIADTAIALYFDVKLGGDRALAQNPPPDFRHFWYAANAKRADVLAEFPDSIRIIELRNAAQPNAVGRLQTYRMLWRDDPAINKPDSYELVTNAFDPDVQRLMRDLGMMYTVLAF